MKNVKIFLVLFWSNLLFLTSTNCYGLYRLELDDTKGKFIDRKSESFAAFPGTNQLIERISKDRTCLTEISNKLRKFNAYNDKEELDCCEACYFIKTLNAKRLPFSENSKIIILKTLEILTTWFIRNSSYEDDMAEAKKLFQNFDFNKLFIFYNEKSVCTIL